MDKTIENKKTLLKIYVATLFLKNFDKYFKKSNVEINKKYNLPELNDEIYNTTILLMDDLVETIKK